MDYFADQMTYAHFLNQLWLTFLVGISMVLVSCPFDAGTRHWALNTLRDAHKHDAHKKDAREIEELMVFSPGWQMVVVLDGLLILNLGCMELSDSVMANTSTISR